MSAIPKALLDALKTGRVVPFVGAGVSLAVKGADGKALFPGWGQLFELAAKRLESAGKAHDAVIVRAFLNKKEFLKAADAAREGLGGQWNDFLMKTFDPHAEPPAAGLELARAVWRLGSKLVITTNYDRVLQWACSPAVPRQLALLSKGGFGSLVAGRCDRETVWHLHGRIDDPDQLILTLDSYKKLYKAKKFEAALSTLREHLKAQTFLFIGFGMEEALRQQIAWVKDTFGGGGGPHYVLVREPQKDEFANALKGLSVELVSYPGYDDLPKLVENLAKHAMPAATKEPERERPESKAASLLDKVERLYRLRETGNHEIERFDDYLCVNVNGETLRIAAGELTDENVSGFRKKVDHVGGKWIYVHEGSATGLKDGVTLQRFQDLQQLVDFGPYKEDLDKRLDHGSYLSKLFVPQEIRYWSNKQQLKGEEADALAEIRKRMHLPNGSFSVILGDFGTGKSFLLRELTRKLLAADSAITPVLIDLRQLNRQRTVESLIASHLTEHGLREINIDKLSYMMQEGLVALLFDGFDELELRVGYDQALRHFEMILSSVRDRARVIVSSRPSYFKSDDQILSALGELANQSHARIYTLMPFDKRRIEDYLTLRLDNNREEAKLRMTLLDEVRDLSGLARNPRLLSFIADFPKEKLLAAKDRKEKITEASLYQEMLDWWLGYEVDRANPSGEKPGLSRDELFTAVNAVALKIWDGQEDVGLAELKDSAKGLSELDLDIAAQQVGSRSLLIRVGERFRFVHASVMEWLVARAAARDLDMHGDLLRGKRMSPLMARFVCDLGEDRAKAGAWAARVLASPDEGPVAKDNALLIQKESPVVEAARIVLAGEYLRGRDLSRRVFRNADLNKAKVQGVTAVGIDLTRADLRGADLGDANLAGALLEGADLRGTDLRFAKLEKAQLTRIQEDGETKWLGARLAGTVRDRHTRPEVLLHVGGAAQSVAYSPDGLWLACAQGSQIVIRRAESGTIVRTLEGHQGSVRSVAFDAQGRYLASGSEDGTIRYWDIATGECLAILFARGEGWVSYRPLTGQYRYGGDLRGRFGFGIDMARYEVGELDEFYPGLRLGEDEALVQG